jgi:hypothetical protein
MPEGSVKLGPVDIPRQKTTLRDLHFVDVEGDGVTEFFSYSSVDGFALFNHQGQPVVTRDDDFMFGGKKNLRDILAGDLDGNGTQEFLSSWYVEQKSQLEAFDMQGHTLWKEKPEFFWNDSAILDLEGDGRPEIIDHSVSKITIFNGRGQQLREIKLPALLGDVDYIWSGTTKPTPQILDINDGVLRVVDFSGKVILQADAPLSYIKLKEPKRIEMSPTEPEFVYTKDSVDVYKKYGAWVRWRRDAPAVLAVVAGFSLLERGVFYVYDEKGKLLYHEVLPEEPAGLAVLPLDDKGEANAILVAGENTVWQYRENQVKPVSSPK